MMAGTSSDDYLRDASAGRGVEQRDRAIVAPDREPAAIRREGQRLRPVALLAQDADLLAVRRVPELHDTIGGSAREAFAVGRECKPDDRRSVRQEVAHRR